MSNGTFTIIADGIDAYGDYVNDIRGHVEELESWGLEYEEQDRRLDPTSATLFISITASVLAAPITAVITKVINSLCDRVTLRQSATSRPPPISVVFHIGAEAHKQLGPYVLPQARDTLIQDLLAQTVEGDDASNGRNQTGPKSDR